MTTLLTMIAVLLLGQWLCGRWARRKTAHMMTRPVDDWDGDDIDRWLAGMRRLRKRSLDG